MWLTSDNPWDPSSLEVPDKLVLLPRTEPLAIPSVLSLYTPKARNSLPTTEHSWNALAGYLSTLSRKSLTPLPSLLGPSPLQLPLRRHIKAQFPQLNQRCLAKTFATDTLFSLTPGLRGISCAQLFVGKSSHFASVYGMQTESKGPSAQQDFIREHSIPNILCNDKSKMQTGTAWNNILCKYSIKAKLTKPHHPQQNPAERRIKTVKTYTSKIMDQTGAPPKTWFLCLLYSVYLLNHTAVEPLGWCTPIKNCFGNTPDISSLLQFTFYELIYFLDQDA